MFTIPLYSLRIIYGIFLLVFMIFMAINFFHLNHTASLTPVSIAMTIFILAIAIIICFGSLTMLRDIDWRQPMFTLPSFYAP